MESFTINTFVSFYCPRCCAIARRIVCVFSHYVVSDSFGTPWTVARQAPLSTGFPRQECWNGLPFPSPGDLPDPGIEPISPSLAGGYFSTEPPGKPKSEA